MKTLKVKANFSYDRIGSFTKCNPYQILFIYTPDEAFVVKGGANDIEKWLLINGDKPMMINYTWWYHGVHRSMWSIKGLTKAKAYISRVKIYGQNKKWELSIYKKGENVMFKKLRRIPRKWMKELTPYI